MIVYLKIQKRKENNFCIREEIKKVILIKRSIGEKRVGRIKIKTNDWKATETTITLFEVKQIRKWKVINTDSPTCLCVCMYECMFVYIVKSQVKKLQQQNNYWKDLKHKWVFIFKRLLIKLLINVFIIVVVFVYFFYLLFFPLCTC